MESITQIILAIIGSGLITTVLNRAWALADKKKAKDTGLQAGLRELLYDKIKFLCGKYVQAGEISEVDYNSLHRMWNVYHNDLGGNGYLDAQMDAVELLKKI